jgi:hypothetical protein
MYEEAKCSLLGVFLKKIASWSQMETFDHELWMSLKLVQHGNRSMQQVSFKPHKTLSKIFLGKTIQQMDVHLKHAKKLS